MKHFLIILSLIIVSQSDCPIWECGDVAFSKKDYCGFYSKSVVTVVPQKISCQSTYYCSLYDVVYDFFYYKDTQTYMGQCSRVNTKSDDGNYRVIGNQFFIQSDCYSTEYNYWANQEIDTADQEGIQDYEDGITEIRDAFSDEKYIKD